MKAKIIFDGKEMEIDITENFSLELESCLPEEKKKTGYERVEQGEFYFLPTHNGKGVHGREDGTKYDDSLYATANYYSDKTVAENNARADKLYRQLRRCGMKIEGKTIMIDISKDITEPTRVCLVCECKENPLSNLVYINKTWLCNKCRAALLKVVEETEKDGDK